MRSAILHNFFLGGQRLIVPSFILACRSVVQRNLSDISTTTAVDSEDLNNVLRNPFGIFAGNHPLLEAQLPKPGQSSSSFGGSSQYYDGGIYQEALEDEMAWDPVSLGVITHEELERLLQMCVLPSFRPSCLTDRKSFPFLFQTPFEQLFHSPPTLLLAPRSGHPHGHLSPGQLPLPDVRRRCCGGHL